MPTHKKISFPGSAGKLEGVVHLPDLPPRAIAVVAHPLPIMGGTMNNKVVTTLTKALVESGYATLRFNFRGVGESTGSYDAGKGEMVDAIDAAEFMQDQFRGLPLLLAGFSFGAFIQARVSSKLQPQKLILVAPAVGRFEMPHVPTNTLLIHGDMDEVVELQELLLWARPQHLSIIILAGAGHFFHGRLSQLRQVILDNIVNQR